MTGKNPIEYDDLIIGLGCEDNYHQVEGAEKYTHSIQTISKSKRTHKQLRHLPDGAKIAIIGGGLSGVELAAELAESSKLQISLFDRGDAILSSYPKKVRNYVERWFKDKKVIVVGTGKSGIGSAALLEKNGALPLIYDGNEQTDKAAVKESIKEKLGHESKAELYLGEFPMEIVKDVELAVLSPGVPVDAGFVVYMKEQGIPVWGEIELAYHFAKTLNPA